MMLKKTRGFTLIELMIVIGIIGIIVALGYPSYRDQVMKSRRAEGMGELLELADRLERFYSDQGTYVGATLGTAATNIYPTLTDKGHYQLTIDSQNAVAFQVIAAPQGKQANDKCGSFELTSLGARTVSGNSINVDQCWK